MSHLNFSHLPVQFYKSDLVQCLSMLIFINLKHMLRLEHTSFSGKGEWVS